MTVDIKGYAFNLGGQAVNEASAEVFAKNGGAKVGSTVETGSGSLDDGEFEFSGVAEGTYDIKVTSGTNVRWRKYDDEIQLAIVEAGSLRLRGTNAAYTHVFQGTPTATRTITFPDKAGTVAMIADVTAAVAAEDTVAELNDTNISSPAAGHILVYDNTASVWDNVALSGGDGLTATLGDGTLALALDLKSNGGAVIESNELAVDLGASSITGTLAVGDGGTGATTLNNLITMGTHTTGNYVATVTAGTGLTSTGGTSGESIAHSLSVDASQGQITTVGALNAGSIDTSFGTINNAAAITGTVLTATTNFTMGDTVVTNGVITDTSGLSLAANVTVTGNLTVNGTTTTVDTATLAVVDPIIHLQTASDGGALGSDTNKDVGIAMQYHTGSAAKQAFLGIDDSDSYKLTFIPDASLSSEVVSGSVGTIKANLEGAVTGNADTVTTNANLTGHVVSSGNAATLGSFTSAHLLGALTNETGTGVAVFNTSPTLVTPALGTPASGVMTNMTGAVTASIGDNQVTLAKIEDIARGSLIIGNASAATAELTKGADGYVLTSDGTDIAWAASTVGDITSIVAGTGLTGSSLTSGDATLNVIGGNGITANANDVAITPAQTTITSIYATDLIIGEDSETAIDFGTADEIDFKINNTAELTLDASSLYPIADAGLDLGTATLGFNDLHLGSAGILNFDNANMTITHSDTVLTVAGGTFATAALTATTFAPTDDITLAADKSLNLPQGANVKFTDAITQDSIDDHDAQGIIFTFQAGMTVTPFSPVYLGTDDEVHECDADAIAKMPCIGVSVNTSNVADGAAIEVMVLGLIRDESFTDFGTNGAPLYVSTTEGVMSNTAPSGTDDVVQVVGHSIGEKLIFVQPCLTTIEHA